MQLHTLFDTVCRCFGHPTSEVSTPRTTDGPASAEAAAVARAVGDSASGNASSSSARKRTNRLELKDKQWDELFDKKQTNNTTPVTPDKDDGSTNDQSASKAKTSQVVNDLGSAQAVAQAKLAANPARYTKRSKRKRSSKAREEIFRSKHNPAANSSNNHVPTSFSRLLNPSIALCFATPIRGTEEEQDDTDVKSVDNSETGTLNTCEDTITSTVYFENKYSHLVETRPPMPLFHQFKIGQDKDEIRNIMATDSHSSLKMIKMLQRQQMHQQQIQQQQVQHQYQQQLHQVDEPERENPVDSDDSSTDSDADPASGSSNHRERSRRPPLVNNRNGVDDQEMEEVPGVKAVSSSTDSSRQSNAAVHDGSPI